MNPAQSAEAVRREDLRYIRARCPVCQVYSPICDQQEDIRRQVISDWWHPHFNEFHRFGPVFERATPTGVPTQLIDGEVGA